MSSTGPKRHHYIPEMLLRNFCDHDGFLWVGNVPTGEVRKSKPHNEFVKNRLYAERSVGSRLGFLKPKDNKYEISLSRLEGNAAPIIKRLIASFRYKKQPVLSEQDETTIKEFLFAMARRTPESQGRIMSSEGFGDVFYEVAREKAERDNYPLPSKSELLQDPDVVRLMQAVRGNMFAGFAAGDDERLRSELDKFCNETSLTFWVIRASRRSFAIGSHGIGILSVCRNEKQTCLPLSHDVCVMPSNRKRCADPTFLSVSH